MNKRPLFIIICIAVMGLSLVIGVFQDDQEDITPRQQASSSPVSNDTPNARPSTAEIHNGAVESSPKPLKSDRPAIRKGKLTSNYLSLKLEINTPNATVKDALMAIKDQTGIPMIYLSDIINEDAAFPVKGQITSLGAVLKQIERMFHISHEVSGPFLLLIKK